VTFHPLTDKVHYLDSIVIASNSVLPGKIILAGHTALGVEEPGGTAEVELYPVPVTGDFLWLKPGKAWPQNLLVEITGISGEVVFSGTLHPEGTHAVMLNTGFLATGIYCLRITGNSFYCSRRFSVTSK
jgi:hypothetical protein